MAKGNKNQQKQSKNAQAAPEQQQKPAKAQAAPEAEAASFQKGGKKNGKHQK